MDVDTRHLRAFLAVVDEGSFTDAAISLSTSQASVSRSVQRLERAVGARLLSRTTRRVELTPAGRAAVTGARRVLAALTDLDVSVVPELRLGYAWAALGEHTVAVQRQWRDEHASELVLVQTSSATAGLIEGRCEIAVVRRPVDDPRLDSLRIGSERRFAVMAADHRLGDAAEVGLADFAGQIVAVDTEIGTTSEELWTGPDRPTAFRRTQGIEEWLTLIASGRAVGISPEATVSQHPRTGLRFRPVVDAPRSGVWLVWWRNDPPAQLDALIQMTGEAYAMSDGLLGRGTAWTSGGRPHSSLPSRDTGRSRPISG